MIAIESPQSKLISRLRKHGTEGESAFRDMNQFVRECEEPPADDHEYELSMTYALGILDAAAILEYIPWPDW